jgi:predicted nucleic acid-binding protein
MRALHYLQLLTVLRELFGTVVVPPAVVRELDAQKYFAAIDFTGLPFVRVQAPLNRKAVTELQLDLDAGEAEAIALAEELHADWLLVALKLRDELGFHLSDAILLQVRQLAGE